MIKRILVPLALVAMAAVALTACGGGGSGDEDKITEAIETAATTADPSNCTEVQTQRFDEQNSATEGAGAVKACEEEAERDQAEQAESVTVSNVSVDGENATAEVELEGGSLNGQTLEMALVEEEGDWKLDQIEGFAAFDGEALAESFQTQYEEESGGLTKEQVTCIAEGIGSANQAEAEELFFSGSPEALEELAQGCA